MSRKCDGLAEEERNGNVQHLRVAGFNSVNNPYLLKLKEFFYVLRAKKVLPQADILVTHAFWAPLLLPKVKIWQNLCACWQVPQGTAKVLQKGLVVFRYRLKQLEQL